MAWLITAARPPITRTPPARATVPTTGPRTRPIPQPGATAHHSTYYGTTAYPAYHPPTTVNYYGSSCYNCGGSSAAGAAAAGLAVGAVAGAAVASANSAQATSNAYNAGVVAGASAVYATGTVPSIATLPANSVTTVVKDRRTTSTAIRGSILRTARTGFTTASMPHLCEPTPGGHPIDERGAQPSDDQHADQLRHRQ